MNPISIPIDYDSWPDYRRFVLLLAERFDRQTEVYANHIYMRLWVHLGYHFQTALTPNGCMPVADFDYWLETLRLDINGEWLRHRLLESKILSLDGDHYFCRPFFLANEELKIAFRDKQLEVYEAKEFYHRQQRAKERSKRDTEDFPIEFYADCDGQTISAEEMNNTICLIRMFDNVLGHRERRKDQFSLTLIHNGCRTLRRLGTEKLDLVLKRLFKKRGTDGIPKTAEQILANFDETLLRIEPQEGWVDWSKILK